MNNLYNPTDVSGIISRVQQLTPEAQRQWGKMTVGQMLAHCHISVETAIGTHNMKRLLMGRIIGSLLKKRVLNEKPFSKNSPTDKSYIFTGDHNFEEERSKLIASIKTFHENGPAKCTSHPHPFFGKFTPEGWAILLWKHLDHHLRQFGV